MRRGLRRRLIFTHAAVAVVAVAVVAAVALLAAERRIEDYDNGLRQARDEAVVHTLVASYRSPAGWDAGAIYALSRAAAVADVDLAVFTPDGKLLFTVQGHDADTGTGATPAPGASPSPRLARGRFELRRYPVTVGENQVATAQVYDYGGRLGPEVAAYHDGVRRDVLTGALIAGVLALLASVVVARRVMAPLEELTDVAQDVSGGNLDGRVSPRGDDEVAAIAVALNVLADKVARDEQWRRDMTVDLSDELRAPLTAIQGRVRALQAAPAHDPAAAVRQDDLRTIAVEAERLGGLLTALRTLNELESEDVGLEDTLLDLADAGREAVARARPGFEDKGVELEGRFAPVAVLADPRRVAQVLDSLLDNALKFTEAGGAVVVATGPAEATSAAPSGARWGTLSVADTGPGIDGADLPFVFDRFYRSSLVRGTQGVGLGLAVARGLVEAEGGTIEAANRLEGGALFTVALPARGAG